MKSTNRDARSLRCRLATIEDLETRQLLACDLGASSSLVADIDCNDEVGFSDFLQLSAAFGDTVNMPGDGADIDSDGVVGYPDFLILAENFGRTAENASPDGNSVRGDRYCELAAVTVDGGRPTTEVWWTNNPTVCTPNVWDVDLEQAQEDLGALHIHKNGPRYFAIDGRESLSVGSVPRIQEIDDMRMIRVVSVEPNPSQTTNRTSYLPALVDRNNVFTWDAGSEVYELTSPAGDVYIMQSYAQIVDPTLTGGDLAGLGSRLELPEGWICSSRVLDEPIAVIASEPIEILQDDLQNTYSKLSDGDQETDAGPTEVTTNEFGTSLVLALVDPAEVNSAGNETTPTRIQLTFDGGVSAELGGELGIEELLAFRLIDENGYSHIPTGFEDVDDNDNQVVLLVPPGVAPASVMLQSNTLYDPTNQPNASSFVQISGMIDLNDELHDLALLDVLSERLGGPAVELR